MSAPRVVITGIGAITPLGLDVATSWDGIMRGVSGAGPITHFDTTNYDARIACEVKDFDPDTYMDRRQAKHLDRYAQFAVAAAKMALADSGLEITDALAPLVGVNVSSGIGGMSTFEKQHTVLMEKGPRRVSPYMIPMLIGDIATGVISMEIGARGPNLALVTACASSAHAIGEATEIIKRGDAVAMISGGAEATITPLAIAGFASMKALSTRNDDPLHASRPFDKNRDGFVMGEGTGVVVLEEYAHARKRGATIYGEVLGYGATGDAYHMTAPDPEGRGAMAVMTRALAKAGLNPEQIDYINAHGTSTPANDRIETLAIKQVFGDFAGKVPVSSTKSLTGHLLGATAAVEAIFCLLAMRDGVIPGTWNYETPDPECDLDYVPNTVREGQITRALSNSFGFGGHNACLILGKV